MPLWGITDESKPKWLTTDEKKESYATTGGWVIEGGSKMSGNGNPDAQPEVLVAIRNLSNRMAEGTITEVEWISAGFDRTTGGTLQVRVRYNEPVTVTGSPTVLVTNGNQGTGSGRPNQTLTYTATGSTTNELVFTTGTIAGGSSDFALSDELTIGAQNILKPGGATIKDTGTAIDSGVAISAPIGAAAGTIIVTES
tara:strand:+ start:113 stop:703 length:591 start_codon:yes stop_codon:yes gene_type:complete